MSQFSLWFNSAFNKWKKSQHGEENFLAFCELLGYSAPVVMSWMQGETEPQDSELLNIAASFGKEVYSFLNKPEPDPELLDIFESFPHLTGENRSKLSFALWKVQKQMQEQGITSNSEAIKPILTKAFMDCGIENFNH